MKYLSKLSNRLAQMHVLTAALMLVALGGCKLIENLQEPIAYDALNPPDETIPLPPTPLSCENEPAGWTRGIDAPMNVLPSRSPNFSAEGFTYYDNQTRTLFIEQSPTAPMSSSSVLRVVFPTGQAGGAAPSRWGSRTLPANTGSIYVCAWIRFMPGWTSNGNIGTKLFFIKSPDATNHFVGTMAGSNFSHAYLMSGMQFQNSGLNYNLGQANDAPNDLAGGGWHKLEVLWRANEPGTRNGHYSHWVDGNLISSRDDAMFFTAGQSPRWSIVWFDPTYGGGLNPVPYDQFFEVDHLIASVQ